MVTKLSATSVKRSLKGASDRRELTSSIGRSGAHEDGEIVQVALHRLLPDLAPLGTTLVVKLPWFKVAVISELWINTCHRVEQRNITSSAKVIASAKKL